MRLFVIQLSCKILMTTLLLLITMGTVSKQFRCFWYSTGTGISDSLSMSIKIRLHKFPKTFLRSVVKELLRFYAYETQFKKNSNISVMMVSIISSKLEKKTRRGDFSCFSFQTRIIALALRDHYFT